MLKPEFLEMQRQDLVTSNDENAKQMLLCFEEVLKDYPESLEIDSSKTCKDCYNKMYEEAKKKAVKGSYCFTNEATKQFILDYLGIAKTENKTFVKLEDFF